MEELTKLWAIVWPILKTIFEMLGVWDIFESLTIYLVSMMFVTLFVKWILPKEKKGSFTREAIHILADMFIAVSPLLAVYFWLKEKFPLVAQLASYILELTKIDDLMVIIGKVILLCIVTFALSRWFIHKVAIILKREVLNWPIIGNILIAVINVAEGFLFAMTLFVLPFWIISLFKQVDPYPIVVQADPVVQPIGISNNTWDYISIGVRNAQANGVACDANLLLALKEYETGANMCTLEQESLPRPNQCASYAGALGCFQFLPETFARNAARYNVQGSLWEPEVAAEVACYFIADEVKISLTQSQEEFASEFASVGLIWNADPSGAVRIYERAKELKDSVKEEVEKQIAEKIKEEKEKEEKEEKEKDNDKDKDEYEDEDEEYASVEGYLWPAPGGSFLWYAWGTSMWYGNLHNGIDIAMNGLPAFKVVAIADGQARYWDGGSCNAGIITLRTNSGEEFLYVHMEWDTSKIDIPTDGSWVKVSQGQSLGRILNGNTTCSIGNHLHLMRSDKSYIGEEEFSKK